MSKCDVKDMEEGKTYRYRIRAYNIYGYGQLTELEHPVIARNPATKPSPPLYLSWSNVTESSVKLCWSAPENDGGALITGLKEIKQ